MSKIYSYFENYRSETFRCQRCQWSGGFEKLDREYYRDLFDGSCPRCNQMLIIVEYPTANEIRTAASQGNAEAKGALPLVQQREALDAAFEQESLKSPDQLPDLAGDALQFAWDRDETHTLIRHGDDIIWREPLFWEGWPRFNQVKDVLKSRYGTRFKSLIPTEASRLYLFGDDLKASEKISYT